MDLVPGLVGEGHVAGVADGLVAADRLVDQDERAVGVAMPVADQHAADFQARAFPRHGRRCARESWRSKKTRKSCLAAPGKAVSLRSRFGELGNIQGIGFLGHRTFLRSSTMVPAPSGHVPGPPRGRRRIRKTPAAGRSGRPRTSHKRDAQFAQGAIQERLAAVDRVVKVRRAVLLALGTTPLPLVDLAQRGQTGLVLVAVGAIERGKQVAAGLDHGLGARSPRTRSRKSPARVWAMLSGRTWTGSSGSWAGQSSLRV